MLLIYCDSVMCLDCNTCPIGVVLIHRVNAIDEAFWHNMTLCASSASSKSNCFCSVAVQELWASQNLASMVLKKDLGFSPSFAMIAMQYCDPRDGWICCADLTPMQFRMYHPALRALQKALIA